MNKSPFECNRKTDLKWEPKNVWVLTVKSKVDKKKHQTFIQRIPMLPAVYVYFLDWYCGHIFTFFKLYMYFNLKLLKQST